MKPKDYLTHLQIKKLLPQAVKLLRHHQIDTPELDARLLLEFALGYSTEELMMRMESQVTPMQLDQYQQLIMRRSQHEPVALIFQRKEFWGRDFKVSQDTLIPRPDSETLIAAALQLLPDQQMPLNILDLGIGSGCLAITLLSEYPNAQLMGVDIHFPALKIARENAIIHQVEDRLILVNASWMSAIKMKFDLIVSNPPYISESDRGKLMPDLNYEPSLALFAGNEGLDCYYEIAGSLPRILKPGGIFIGECGTGQDLKIEELFHLHGMKFIDKFYDLANLPRCLAFTV